MSPSSATLPVTATRSAPSSPPRLSLFPKAALLSEKENFLFGNHLYIRDEQINLENKVKELQPNVRYLHLYCDSLISSQTTKISVKLPATLLSLQIFARELLPNVEELIFDWTDDSTESIEVYFDQASDLVVRHEKADRGIALMHKALNCAKSKAHDHIAAFEAAVTEPTEQSKQLVSSGRVDAESINRLMVEATKVNVVKPDVSTSSIGRRIWVGRDPLLKVDVLDSVSPFELEGPLLTDLMEYGPVLGLGRIDNLPKLLNQLFVLVSKEILRPKATVKTLISRVRFIVRCCRLSATYANLASDAQKLLDRLDLPDRYFRTSDAKLAYYVPQLGFKQLAQSAEDAIRMVKGVEAQIEQIYEKKSAEKGFRDIMGTLFTEMGNNMKGFIDTQHNFDKVQDATADCEEKRRDMDRYIASTQEANLAFNRGIEEYQKKKDREFWSNLWLAIGEAIVGVVVAVATCGAGSPLALGNVKKMAETIEKGLSTWEKLKTLAKKLFDVLSKLLPKLYEAFKGSQLTQSTVKYLNQDPSKNSKDKSLEDVANDITSRTRPADVTAPIDFLDILADWDEFDIRVDALFAEYQTIIGDEIISGMTEFKIALKSQAVRGRTVIAAMRNVQEASQFYQRQEVELVAREARVRELKAVAGKVINVEQEDIFRQVGHWSLLQESFNSRRNTFPWKVNLSDDRLLRIVLRAIFEVVLDEAKTKFDNAMEKSNTFGASVMISTEKDASEDGEVLNSNWKDVLKSDQKFYFKIPYDYIGLTRGYWRVRTTKLTATFTGMKVDPGTSYQWDWELGPNFVDKDNRENPIQYYMPTQILRQTDSQGDWVDQYGGLPDPSLFYHGRIVFRSIAPNRKPGQAQRIEPVIGVPGINFDDVTKVELSFDCIGINRKAGINTN